MCKKMKVNPDNLKPLMDQKPDLFNAGMMS